jgi:hypothetical protein
VREKLQPFGIWAADRKWKVEYESRFHFLLSMNQIELASTHAPTYWELDPCWDGATFRSYAQAVLPLRDGEIARNLPLPQQKTGGRICIRAVTAEGEQHQTILE